MAFVMLWMIKEPQLHNSRSRSFQASSLRSQPTLLGDSNLSVIYQDESVLTKGRKLTKHILSSCTHKPVIPLCFFANVVVRCNIILLSTYMTLWTSSYIGQPGVRDEAQAQEIVQSYSLFSVLTTLIFIVPLGRMADAFKYKHLISFVTCLKLTAIGLFFQLTDPSSLTTTLVYILMILSHASQNLFSDAVLSKNIPRDIRASMLAMY